MKAILKLVPFDLKPEKGIKVIGYELLDTINEVFEYNGTVLSRLKLLGGSWESQNMKKIICEYKEGDSTKKIPLCQDDYEYATQYQNAHFFRIGTGKEFDIEIIDNDARIVDKETFLNATDRENIYSVLLNSPSLTYDEMIEIAKNVEAHDWLIAGSIKRLAWFEREMNRLYAVFNKHDIPVGGGDGTVSDRLDRKLIECGKK